MTAPFLRAPLLALELDREASCHRVVPAAQAAGADGVVLPAALLPSTRVPDVDALSFALPLPVPALSTSVTLGDGHLERVRLVALVRAAQRLGGEGVRLLLTAHTTSAAEDDELVDLLNALADLSAAFGVVLALDDDGSNAAGRALSWAERIPGTTVVASQVRVGGRWDGVLSRSWDGNSPGAGRVVWQVRRQSELAPTGG